MFKLLVRSILSLFYRVEVKGLEHYRAAGKRVLIVANHTSFLDGLLLGSFLPDRISFAINTQISRLWFSRLIKPFVNLFVMDPTNPLSLKSLIRYMQQDCKVVIFPEGRITVTGALMKIYNGPGLVADRSEATVLPVRIDGAQYTPFSRLRGRVRLRWFPKITLTILPAQKIRAPENIRGRARRKYAGQALTHIMTDMMFATSNYRRTIMDGVIDAQRIHGYNHLVVEDIERRPLSYRQVLTRAFIVGNKIKSQTERGEYVGVLLPNAIGTVLVFLGLQIHGRVPAMLNFSSGAKGMLNACAVAKIKTVYTSRRFVSMGRLEQAVAALGEQVRIVYLEDLIPQVTLFDKLRGAINARFARAAYRKKSGNAGPDDPAVVLFTSGSEGVPKGVVLSHANILANGIQLSIRIDFSAQDIIFSALPMFHSFGLTAGTLLPLLSGMRAFFYPSPLHYRIVPEMVYEVNATVLFGTNTFLKGYARFAHPYDFYSVRYVFAGAEKLQEDTRRVWNERFGIRIFEGYGATETSPVLAANTPMEHKAGTVGRLLPGMQIRREPIAGVASGGRLLVKGPNIMLGYLLHDQPGVIRPVDSGWYDTGDIVSFDDEGYLTIAGRAKRFAKIGGEMVSLSAVEEMVAQVWPNQDHAVVTIPDTVKGEQLVLVTAQPDAHRGELLDYARGEGIAELMIPKKILCVKTLPLLGSGKTDYPAVHQLIKDYYQD
ncbi:MAG: AMP-binding protein [Gammaproteobacteria bacterium]|nr:AMP-binding protein [Gammaproteobacteria bacterium]